MARIRSIKPEFFLHEGLAEMSPLHRLLFIGLWTLADKEGRIEYRPRRIKAALFPWEDCAVENLIADLVDAGFVRSYEVDGVWALVLPSFHKHQRPHPKEAASTIPPPPADGSSREIPRLAVKGFSTIPSAPGGREGDLGYGKESWEGKESPPPTAPAGKKPPAPEKPEKQPDPRHTPLVKALMAETPGYAFTGRDAKAVSELLTLGTDQEIRDRWRRARASNGFPKVRTLPELATHWNHFTQEQPARRTGEEDPCRLIGG